MQASWVDGNFPTFEVEAEVEEGVGRGGDVGALAAVDFGAKLTRERLVDDARAVRVGRAGASRVQEVHRWQGCASQQRRMTR